MNTNAHPGTAAPEQVDDSHPYYDNGVDSSSAQMTQVKKIPKLSKEVLSILYMTTSVPGLTSSSGGLMPLTDCVPNIKS
jgi:hypothetical protein